MNIKENIEAIRADFPILKRKMDGYPLDYLDNSATTLKPQSMIDAVVHYYTYLGANAHRGDYQLSAQVDAAYEGARKTTAEFINAKKDEIVFTSGTTESLNVLAMMISNQWMEKGDYVLTIETEHASSILPWQQAGEAKGIQVEFIELTEQGRLLPENVEKALQKYGNRVKVVAIAQVSNVLGYLAPIEEIAKICHAHDVLLIVDGAQSVAHQQIDVKKMDCDFFCFSAHKLCGPTGIGVLYGKEELLNALQPVIFGGESNARFYKYEKMVFKRSPYKFESGTQPIEGALGMAAAMKYLQKIGLSDIHDYELELKRYFLDKIKPLGDKIKVYNAESESGIITFNVYDQGKLIFPQDIASYLSHLGIAVRSGHHCAKLMGDYIKAPGTVRASVYFYNTFEDIDRLVDALSKATFESCLDIFF